MNLIHNYRIRIAGILVLTALRFGFISSDQFAGLEPISTKALLDNLLAAFLTGVIIWETNRAFVLWFHRARPLGKLFPHRFAWEALIVVAGNTLVYVPTLGVFYLLGMKEPPLFYLLMGFFDRYLYGMLVAAFYEVLLFMEAWRKATQETEELKKVNLMQQLESLKNQVKPHFLFNSLNTLTGLVETDTPRAVKFIAELSKVYRYLLQSNEKELIALAQELEFTQAYYFLLQTRFGSGISLHINADEKERQLLIPPLTLQMLLENAVKHNQVSARKPLQVVIGIEEKWLVVQNNIQPKRSAPPSNGTGLSNITAKYRLLNQPQVIIQSGEHRFTVKVPLIKPTV